MLNVKDKSLNNNNNNNNNNYDADLMTFATIKRSHNSTSASMAVANIIMDPEDITNTVESDVTAWKLVLSVLTPIVYAICAASSKKVTSNMHRIHIQIILCMCNIFFGLWLSIHTF